MSKAIFGHSFVREVFLANLWGGSDPLDRPLRTARLFETTCNTDTTTAGNRYPILAVVDENDDPSGKRAPEPFYWFGHTCMVCPLAYIV